MEKNKLTVSKIDVFGTNASAFNRSSSSFNVVPSGALDLKIEFKPTVKRSYAE